MPWREWDREQVWLMPPSLDEVLADDHPARLVAAFVDSLTAAEWAELGVDLGGQALGAPAYHPRALLGIWLYGFMTGVRSARRLETAGREQLALQWLSGYQQPDHNTLWRFYQAHRNQLRGLLRHTVQIAARLGLVDWALQAVDGTKVAGSASSSRTYDARQLERLLERTERAIADLEAQNEAGDEPAAPRLPADLAEAQRLRAEVLAARQALAASERRHVNLTDPDARLLRAAGGYLTGYNAQAMAVTVRYEAGAAGPLEDAVSEGHDGDAGGGEHIGDEESENRSGKGEDVGDEESENRSSKGEAEGGRSWRRGRGQDPQRRAVDHRRGRHPGPNRPGPAAADDRGRRAVRRPRCGTDPGRRRLLLGRQPGRLRRARDARGDPRSALSDRAPLPPQPLRLRPRRRLLPVSRGSVVELPTPQASAQASLRAGLRGRHADCLACPAFGRCTTSTQGRRIEVSLHADALTAHRHWMQTAAARDAFRRRKQLIEPVFGIIKEQQAGRRFLLRGLEAVRSEWTLLAVAFNLRTLAKALSGTVDQPRSLRPGWLIGALQTTGPLQTTGATRPRTPPASINPQPAAQPLPRY